MSKKNNQIEYNDLGLGTKTSTGRYRSLNKDGSFNVKKENVPFLEKINFFHSLISMPWLHFFVVIIGGYFVVNTIFAFTYLLIGVEHLTGIQAESVSEKFMECFFFSSQTITTLGYGRIAPIGMIANTVASVESMLGLLAFALATGLLYGRFSKPSGKIKYSSYAVLAPYQNINAFMFRVVNPQSNQLLEVEVNVSFSLKRDNSDSRDFYTLELERNKVVFFPSMWTVVHPISETSPLYKLSEAEMLEKDAEFIVIMKAFDESFSQTVYSRTSYRADEIKWGEKFVYLIKNNQEGVSVDVGRIDETEIAKLNE
jgi:inward rectifier potassium channel